MKRKLPPFPALRAFEAAARLGSFKSAAEELCVTPSAISHQISLLETFVDKPLFRRCARNVILTADGLSYLERVSPILDELDASTREVIGAPPSGQLRLKMTEWFAKRWLIPRLPSFMQTCPDIDLKIETGLPPTDFRGGEPDVIIHWGDDPVPGVVIEPFFSSTRTPVCSPAYLTAHPDLIRPENLPSHVLLRDETSDGWQEWFKTAGFAELCPEGGPVFAHCELSTNAALSGAGIALSYRELLVDLIDGGQLKQIFDVLSPIRTIYSLAYERKRARDPLIIAFRNWLYSQILNDAKKTLAA